MSLISDGAPKKVALRDESVNVAIWAHDDLLHTCYRKNTWIAVARVKANEVKPISVLANVIGANDDSDDMVTPIL
jgi:hypothetical protein